MEVFGCVLVADAMVEEFSVAAMAAMAARTVGVMTANEYVAEAERNPYYRKKKKAKEMTFANEQHQRWQSEYFDYAM